MEAKKATVTCPEHEGEEATLYCVTCEKSICWKCIKDNEKHHEHKYDELNVTFEKYKEDIVTAIERLENQLTTTKETLTRSDSRRDEIFEQQAAIKSDVQKTFEQFREILKVKEDELISQIDKLTEEKQVRLEAQRKKIEITHEKLSSCLLLMRENLKTGKRALTMKEGALSQVKEQPEMLEPKMLEPNAEADMIFSMLKDLSDEIWKYGEVYLKSSPDPSKCYATGQGIDTAEVEETSTAVLQALNINSQPCIISADSVSCELVHDRKGDTIKASIENKGESQCKISYQPTIKGRHQLHIKVNNEHIKGSPFPVSVRSPKEELGKQITTMGSMWHPDGVAVNKEGEVVVIDRDKPCVTVFKPNGKKLHAFGEKGSGQGQFNKPSGVAVDSEDNIYVADRKNHRIQKFSAQGGFLAAVANQEYFHTPRGIAVNASSKVYITESENGRIQILNSDLSHQSSFGSKGSGKGQLNNPEHIAFDSTGNVYVADSGNHRVQVFTAEGKFLRQFGVSGEGEGVLKEPYGLAIDYKDRVYVSESKSNRISIFSSDGQFIKSFEQLMSKFPTVWKQNFFTGLAVDSSGVVYACGDNVVQLF